MNAETTARGRRSIRLAHHDYSSPGAYFVTVCTHNRQCLFGEIVDAKMRPNAFGRIVRSVWDELPRHYPGVELDTFVVMPNHVHGIVVITTRENDVTHLVRHDNDVGFVGAIHELPLRQQRRRTGQWQPEGFRAHRRPMLLGRIVGQFKMTTAKAINLSRGTTGVRVWQRNYYEHAIRDVRDMLRIRAYILANPARWVRDPENAPSIDR